jgi:hypothetical protein
MVRVHIEQPHPEIAWKNGNGGKQFRQPRGPGSVRAYVLPYYAKLLYSSCQQPLTFINYVLYCTAMKMSAYKGYGAKAAAVIAAFAYFHISGAWKRQQGAGKS